MSRYREGGPRCDGITEANTRYQHRCRSIPVPGMKRCHYHGVRPARIVVKDGPRRGTAEISCVHMSVRVTFSAGESAMWAREIIKYTTPHRCFAPIRKQYRMQTMSERRKR